MKTEDALHEVFRELGRAHASKDARALLACYAPDALIFDLAPPLATRGRDLAATEAWFATWDGPITVDAAEVDINMSADLAWVSALNRMRGRKVDGEVVDVWFRTTMGLRRTGGRWLIVHDHSSTPFYMDGSYRAAVDLVPQS